MKIHKLANLIALPFGICLLIIAYLVYDSTDSKLLFWAIVPITALVLIYLFSPQINYWWLSKNPVSLDPPIRQMLFKTNPIYESLQMDQQKEFDKRLLLFVEGKEFTGKGREEDTTNIPYDIKNLISQVPITMTLNLKEFTFKNFDRIILYKHPFPSPKFQFLHTVETHVEDGLIIFSLEHIQKSLFNKEEYYDITWHGFAEAFVKLNPNLDYPDIPNNIWQDIEEISPQTQQEILNILGFKTIDPLPVLINLYFNYRTAFGKKHPSMLQKFDEIFNTNDHLV